MNTFVFFMVAHFKIINIINSIMIYDLLFFLFSGFSRKVNANTYD
jgi:hypothetical protein